MKEKPESWKKAEIKFGLDQMQLRSFQSVKKAFKKALRIEMVYTQYGLIRNNGPEKRQAVSS